MSRAYAQQTTDRIAWSGGPLLYNQTAASVMCWFRHAGTPASGAALRIMTQSAAFNKEVWLHILVGGANDGKVEVIWRTPTALALFNTSGVYDDNAWHRLLYVRRNSSPFVELYIDGSSVGSSTTNPGTDATAAVDQYWGNDEQEAGSFGGTLARCAFIAGTTLTVAQADTFLYSGNGVTLSQWLEMLGDSPEPDWSGNSLTGTVTGTSLGVYGPWGFAKRGAESLLLPAHALTRM